MVVRAHEQLPLTPVGRSVRFVLVRSAAAVVTVSRDTARRFNEGLERPIATHVYNSFDRDRFDPDRVAPARVREELGIDPDAALLGQVAQITPWKGQDTAIRAVAELRRDGLDVHLLIIGEVAFAGKTVRYDNHGFLRDLHGLVDELGVGGAVHFVGRRSDVPALMRTIDLSLLPSWDEPFANVMLESMAMGTPLLVSEVGGGPELVEDGVSGRLLPPKRPGTWAKAVKELLADRPALERMGRRAREATTGFNDERHARDMLAVYQRVLGGPAPSRTVEEPAGGAMAGLIARVRTPAAGPVERTRCRSGLAAVGGRPVRPARGVATTVSIQAACAFVLVLLVVEPAPVRPALGNSRHVRALVARSGRAPDAGPPDRSRGQRPALACALRGHCRHRGTRAREGAHARARATDHPRGGGGLCARAFRSGWWRGPERRSTPSAPIWPRSRRPCWASTNVRRRRAHSTVRNVLLFGLPPLAAYAILQRVVPLSGWDQAWLDAVDFNSIGAPAEGEVRVFATLNSPGAFAPLLALSLLCYLTIRPRYPALALVGAGLVSVALALTYVRSAWIALMVAALAHVIASRGQSARRVFGAAAVVAAATLALAPVLPAAADVVDRFDTIGNLGDDRSATERSATVSETAPEALRCYPRPWPRYCG